MADQAITLTELLAGAEPRPTIREGFNTFVTPILPRYVEGVTPEGEEVSESMGYGQTIFVSAEFYDRVWAMNHPEEKA